MNIAIDTNRYADFMNGVPEVGNVLARVERIVVPFAVLAELRYGFLFGSKASENERRLQRFLSKPRVETIFPDERTTHEYARLTVQLRRQGTPIPVNDLWIAALSIQHDLTLYARDAHFDHIPQLARL